MQGRLKAGGSAGEVGDDLVFYVNTGIVVVLELRRTDAEADEDHFPLRGSIGA